VTVVPCLPRNSRKEREVMKNFAECQRRIG
jgi:hypothetical protein